MKTYKIDLIRSGLYEDSGSGMYIGHTDLPLSKEGKREICLLAGKYEYPRPDVVISSPLVRCTDTAKILYPDKEPIEMPGLIEFDFGEFEGHTAAELAQYEEFGKFLAGGPDAGALNGETNAEFQKRVCGCFAGIVTGMIKAGTSRASIVTHGGVIAAIMASFAIPEQPLTYWFSGPGRGYTLNVIPGIWANIGKAEVYDTIPETGGGDSPEEYAGKDEGDLPIDPDDFRGFYTPEDEL